MTHEEIKKIAEEYVNDIVNRMGIPKDYVSAETKKGLRYDCEPILQWLTARFYLVEKGKAEQEYQYSKKSYERNKGDEGYFEGYWEGRVDSYEDIFGPDIRKEEEE